jgi:regulator of replication initiation timing
MEAETIAKMQKQIEDLKTENGYLQEKVRILTLENVKLMNRPQKNPLRFHSKEQEDEKDKYNFF